MAPLQGGAWLTDEIINASAALMLRAYRRRPVDPARPRPRVFALSSHFLAKLERDNVEDLAGAVRWLPLRSCQDGDDAAAASTAFDADVIVAPASSGNSHWALVTARPRERTIEYVDSLGLEGAAQLRLVAACLNEGLAAAGWERVDWRLLLGSVATPQQQDGHSCGDFVLMELRSLLDGDASVRHQRAYHQSHQPNMRRLLGYELAQGFATLGPALPPYTIVHNLSSPLVSPGIAVPPGARWARVCNTAAGAATDESGGRWQMVGVQVDPRWLAEMDVRHVLKAVLLYHFPNTPRQFTHVDAVLGDGEDVGDVLVDLANLHGVANLPPPPTPPPGAQAAHADDSFERDYRMTVEDRAVLVPPQASVRFPLATPHAGGGSDDRQAPYRLNILHSRVELEPSVRRALLRATMHLTEA